MKHFLPVGSERQQTKQAQPAAEMVSAGKSQRFLDNRSEALTQHKLKETINASPKMVAQRKLAAALNNSPRMLTHNKLHVFINDSTKQLQAVPEEEPFQGNLQLCKGWKKKSFCKINLKLPNALKKISLCKAD